MPNTAPNPFASHPDLIGQTDADVLAWLLADVETIDTRSVTIARLREGAIPIQLYLELITSFIDAAALADSDNPLERALAKETGYTEAAMAGGGFDLHTDARQALLEDTAPRLGWSPELLAALKAVGRPIRKRWQISQLASEPTIAEVAVWRANHLTANWWTAKKAQVDDRLHAGTITTQQQIVDLLGGG
jgi:hypothetical protein